MANGIQTQSSIPANVRIRFLTMRSSSQCAQLLILDTHCAKPPTPNATYGLEPTWDGQLIAFDTSIDFTCVRGMKVAHDFNLTVQKATCRDGNKWDEPQPWRNCVESA